jgi:hypothetical protein
MFSTSVNDTYRVVSMTVIGDATTWSFTYDRHSDDTIGVIYYCNMFKIQGPIVYNFYGRNVRIFVIS